MRVFKQLSLTISVAKAIVKVSVKAYCLVACSTTAKLAPVRKRCPLG